MDQGLSEWCHRVFLYYLAGQSSRSGPPRTTCRPEGGRDFGGAGGNKLLFRIDEDFGEDEGDDSPWLDLAEGDDEVWIGTSENGQRTGVRESSMSQGSPHIQEPLVEERTVSKACAEKGSTVHSLGSTVKIQQKRASPILEIQKENMS